MGNACCAGRGGYVSEQPRDEELAGVLPNPAADSSQPVVDVAESALQCTETSTQTGTNDWESLEMLLIREVVKCNGVILRDAYSVSSVTAKLVADGVLAEEEQTAILSQDSDAEKKDKMIQYLSNKRPGAFYSFCRNVQSESETGAKVIQLLAGELHDLDANIAFADKMGVQVSGTPPQLQEKGAVLAETLVDKDMWENLCHRTKAKQVMVAENTKDVQWALVSALQETIKDISADIASMRNSCLKMQQVTEANEGQDAGPQSSDADLKEEVHQALKFCDAVEAKCREISTAQLESKVKTTLDLRARLTAVCKERDLCKQKVEELQNRRSDQTMLRKLQFKMSRTLQRKVQYLGVCKGSLQFPSEPGKLWGLAVSPTGVLYVGDWDNHCIHIFDADRKYIKCIGKQESAFNKPRGIAISEEGQLLVANSNRIEVIGGDGSFIRHFGENELENPKSLAIDVSSGKVYVTDYDSHCICVFSKDGTLVQKFGAKGSKSGEFHFPLDLSISVHGHLYVTDTQNHRIQVFTLNGEYVREFSTGQQSNPFGVLVLADDTVLTFAHEKQISAFNDKGEAIHTFGQRGKAEGCFKDARVLVVDHNGDLLISEWKNKRVQIF